MLVFEPLASSSAGCAYRLSGGGASAPLLLDAGLPFKKLRQALDFQVTCLAGCLLSHAHGDHSKGVQGLLDSGVEVFASSETWAELPAMETHHLAQHCTFSEHKIGDWRVLPFSAVHDSPGTLGFLIGSPDGSRLLYLTDSAYSPWRYEGLTHLAIECNHSVEIVRANVLAGTLDPDRAARTMRNHMSLERLLDILAANDLSKVEEIHLLHLSDQNSDEEGFKRAVQSATGVPVFVAASRAVPA